jgi:hypothetical protein
MKFTAMVLAASLYAAFVSGCATPPAQRLVYEEAQFANRLEYLRFCQRYAMQDHRCG